MGRPLIILAGGVLVAVIVAVLISPIQMLREVLAPVLITVGLGVVVLLVTARRAALRDRAIALAEAQHRASGATDTTTDFTDTSRTDGEEPDRG